MREYQEIKKKRLKRGSRDANEETVASLSKIHVYVISIHIVRTSENLRICLQLKVPHSVKFEKEHGCYTWAVS